MKNNFKTAIFWLASIFTIAGCEKPDCENANPILSDFKPDQTEYKNEIARLMESEYDKLKFWFNDYSKNENGEFIDVQISGDKLCATAALRVTDWTKLSEIQNTKGQGWSGAELVGLKFTLEKESANSYFLYKDLEKIVD